jgi:5-methylthioadenosine/S-adenosylhomocysteine deaminase
MGILLRNGLVLRSSGASRADVLIEGNTIKKIAKSISEKAEFSIDCSKKLVMPGLCNTHGHLAMSLLRGYGDDMLLEDWLQKRIWPAEAKLSSDGVYWGSLLSCAEMIKSGTTSCADMYFHIEESAKAVEKSGMRGNLSYGMIDLGDEEKREKELAKNISFVDSWHGKAEGRIACSLGPHSIYTCSKELLEKTAALSKKKKLSIQLHLAETRKELNDSKKNFGKRPLEYADSLGLVTPNTILAHCGWVSLSEIKTIAKRGAHISHNPESNLKLASGIAPVPEMLSEGANVSLGTDGAASNNSLSLFSSMKICALIHKVNRWDATVVNAQQVLNMATANGAKALGIDAGELKEGKLADIITLGLDAPSLNPQHSIISNLVYSENGSSVCDSIIDGKIVMLDRRIQTFDERLVIEKARKVSGELAF